MFRRGFSILTVLFSAVLGLRAQTDSLLVEGDRLHRQYRFEEAMDLYARAAAGTADKDTIRLLRDRMDRSQNALNMTDFCADPVVVARERFSRKDFFLFYPLKNQTWRLPPHSLDPSEDGFPTYAPRGGQSLCFSAPDATGFRNLYVSATDGTEWSNPELMGEHLLSPGNEVFPMLSEDGKTLTFSSDGLHGMGGYDLYRSVWNEETGTWGEPVNLGFPYSSPCVICLCVSENDDVLLIKQSYGIIRFVCVAGYIKAGENAEDAAKREIAEETGLEMTGARFLYSKYYDKHDNLMLAFLCRVKKAELRISSELTEAQWFSPKDAENALFQGAYGIDMLHEWQRLRDRGLLEI